jgi:hypothetical protein
VRNAAWAVLRGRREWKMRVGRLEGVAGSGRGEVTRTDNGNPLSRGGSSTEDGSNHGSSW